MSLSSSLYSFLHSPVISSSLGSSVYLSPLCWKTRCLCFSLNVRDQVSHPYETKGKIIVLYTSMSIFLDSSPQTEAKNKRSQRIGAFISRIGGTRHGERRMNIRRTVLRRVSATFIPWSRTPVRTETDWTSAQTSATIWSGRQLRALITEGDGAPVWGTVTSKRSSSLQHDSQNHPQNRNKL